MSDLADVLEQFRADAAVLRRAGHESEAVLCERFAADVERSAGPWLTWLSETKAMMRSARSREWLRARFGDWERDGHARTHAGERFYREAIVPQRHTVADAHTAGAEAARRARKIA